MSRNHSSSKARTPKKGRPTPRNPHAGSPVTRTATDLESARQLNDFLRDVMGWICSDPQIYSDVRAYATAMVERVLMGSPDLDVTALVNSPERSKARDVARLFHDVDLECKRGWSWDDDFSTLLHFASVIAGCLFYVDHFSSHPDFVSYLEGTSWESDLRELHDPESWVASQIDRRRRLAAAVASVANGLGS